jgi:hypothetical protein
MNLIPLKSILIDVDGQGRQSSTLLH